MKNKSQEVFVKTILATFLIVLLLLPVSSFGEIQTVTHTVKQPFGGSQSPDDARISAVAKAKREALEMAGTYIENLTSEYQNTIKEHMIHYVPTIQRLCCWQHCTQAIKYTSGAVLDIDA
jgi:hypothetical protein